MDRREFLAGGTMAALLAGCRTGLWGSGHPQVSVQTFVLRDLLKKDLEGTYAKIGALGVGGEPPPGKTAVDWQGLKAAFAADRPEWFVIEPVTSDRFDTISRSIEHLEGMEIV